jgi:DNA-binding IclR family transcriptional regulator
LAFADRAVQERVLAGTLHRYTEQTVTDAGQLQQRLDEIRRLGYAFSDQEVDPGVRAVAAPICSSERGLVAALSLVAPSGRLPDSEIPRLGALVKQSASRLSFVAELRA